MVAPSVGGLGEDRPTMAGRKGCRRARRRPPGSPSGSDRRACRRATRAGSARRRGRAAQRAGDVRSSSRSRRRYSGASPVSTTPRSTRRHGRSCDRGAGLGGDRLGGGVGLLGGEAALLDRPGRRRRRRRTRRARRSRGRARRPDEPVSVRGQAGDARVPAGARARSRRRRRSGGRRGSPARRRRPPRPPSSPSKPMPARSQQTGERVARRSGPNRSSGRGSGVTTVSSGAVADSSCAASSASS